MAVSLLRCDGGWIDLQGPSGKPLEGTAAKGECHNVSTIAAMIFVDQ